MSRDTPRRVASAISHPHNYTDVTLMSSPGFSVYVATFPVGCEGGLVQMKAGSVFFKVMCNKWIWILTYLDYTAIY